MAEADGVPRTMAWRDLFPCGLLLRVFRLSTRPTVLALATLAALLTPCGWTIAEALFLPENLALEDPEFAVAADTLAQWPGQQSIHAVTPNPWRDPVLLNRPVSGLWDLATAEVRLIYNRYVAPFRLALTPGQRLSRYAYLLFGCLWTLGVWSFCGGAITRIAVLRFGPEQRVGLKEAFRFTLRRLPAYFLSPLFPLLAVAALVILCAPLGLLMRLQVGVLIAGILWLLVLLAGLAMAVLLVGLTLGWPLMWPTISSEESGDVFEATQRCYSYTFDRPLNYLLYFLIAALLGGLGWILVLAVSEAVIELGFWAVAWSAGSDRVGAVIAAATDTGEMSGAAGLGGTLIGWSVALVRTVATAYLHAYFWCSASAIYLLLRYDVDQTELDEVFVEEDEERFGLPPLEMDEHGVPTLVERQSGKTESPVPGDDNSESAAADAAADASASGSSESAPEEGAEPGPSKADSDSDRQSAS